jgi:hypothetical protein
VFTHIAASPASDTRYTAPIRVEAGAAVDALSVRAFAVRGGVFSEVVTHSFVKGLNIDTRFCDNTLVFVVNGDPHG